MVGHQVAKKFKPEKRKLGQHPPLVRDAGGQYIVKGGNAVGGDKQQPVFVQMVNVAHLAAGVQFEFGEVGLQQNGVEKLRAHE